ncbi:MAG TPA: 7-cyano-7-deazaguanine synthase [Tepidisphaeraceae bacterium]|nr:7-cyano-7-deazaguanine synthase [Tepidisphaeraceae bacterium]
MDLRQFGGSALTDDIDVPKDQLADSSATQQRDATPPVTYVPARNLIFLGYALAWAEVIDCNDVFLGVNALDFSGYPDCRPEFIASFQQTARLGTRRRNFTVHAPLIDMTKAQIIQRGNQLGVDYSLTQSCYDPVERSGVVLACGHCDSCLLRKRGFVEAGVVDPTRYV